MFCAGFTIFFPLYFPSKILMIYLLWPFFLQLHLVLIFLLFLREYFGNQASLTNCTGTLIRLTDSTASAPPVRRNKGSFQRVSFFTIHMSWDILSFNFPWYFPEKSGTFCFIFPSHFNGFILFNLFCWIISFSHPFIPLIHAFIFPSCFIYYSVDFYLFNLFVKLSNPYSFIYSYLYIRIHSDIIIHLFIRILIGLALCLPFELFSHSLFLLSHSYFSSCLAVFINYFVFRCSLLNCANSVYFCVQFNRIFNIGCLHIGLLLSTGT